MKIEGETSMRTLGYRIGLFSSGQVSGIYAVILDSAQVEKGGFYKISKYPATPRNSGEMTQFLREVEEYAKACEHPTFRVDDFGIWEVFIGNGWEMISDEGLQVLLNDD